MFLNLKLNIWCFTKFKYRFAEQFWIWPLGSLNTVPNCIRNHDHLSWPDLPLSSEFQRESHVQTLSNTTKLWLFVRGLSSVSLTCLCPMASPSTIFTWTLSLYVNCFPLPDHRQPLPPPHPTRDHLILFCVPGTLAISWPIAVAHQMFTELNGYEVHIPQTSEWPKRFKNSVNSKTLSSPECEDLYHWFTLSSQMFCAFQKHQHLGAHCRVSLWVSFLPCRGLRFESWILTSPGIWPCVCSWFGFVAFVVRSLGRMISLTLGITKAQLFPHPHDAVLLRFVKEAARRVLRVKCGRIRDDHTGNLLRDRQGWMMYWGTLWGGWRWGR